MIYIDAILIPIIAVLWNIGGDKQAWVRDLLIPIIIGIALFFHHPVGVWWKDIIVSVLTVGTANCIRIGYGSYDPVNDDKPSLLAKITKDKDGWIIRMVWGALCGIAFFIPEFIFNFDFTTISRCILFTTQLMFVCFLVVRLRSNKLFTDLFIGGSIALFLMFHNPIKAFIALAIHQ